MLLLRTSLRTALVQPLIYKTTTKTNNTKAHRLHHLEVKITNTKKHKLPAVGDELQLNESVAKIPCLKNLGRRNSNPKRSTPNNMVARWSKKKNCDLQYHFSVIYCRISLVRKDIYLLCLSKVSFRNRPHGTLNLVKYENVIS